MALHDLIARHLEIPLFELFGGRHRTEVPCALLMGAFPIERPVPVEELDALFADLANVAIVVDKAKALVAESGYATIKIKSAGLRPDWDVAVLRAMRETFGAEMRLRLDANGGYGPLDALRLGRAVEDLNLEYLEDPVSGIESMARLRRDLRTPFATNMCVINPDQLAPGLRARCADVILGDVFHWGGPSGFRELAATCKAFHVDMGMHSFWEMGPATAVNLHLAAGHRQVNHAIDGILWLYGRDIAAGPRMVVKDGVLPVPNGPGAGVDLDEDAIARFTVEEATIGDAPSGGSR